VDTLPLLFALAPFAVFGEVAGTEGFEAAAVGLRFSAATP